MHNPVILTFDKNYPCKKIETNVMEYISNSGDGYGTESIKFLDRIFRNYSDAQDFLYADHGEYSGLAVQYKEYSSKDTAKMKDYRSKLIATKQKKDEFEKQHSVKLQKATFIGCSSCGSKLNREKLHGEKCPLCQTDLRSETTLKRIESFKQRIKEYENKIQTEKEKEHYNIKWAVKFEYHS